MSKLTVKPGPPCPQCGKPMACATDQKTEWWMCVEHGRQEVFMQLGDAAPQASITQNAACEIKPQMKAKLEEAVKAAAEKSKSATSGTEAMKYTQAALNAAHALATLANMPK